MSILARLRGQRVYQLDTIVVMLISLQIFINTFLAVKYSKSDVYVAIVNVVFIVLTLTGLILHQAFCGGIKFDKRLVPTEFNQIMFASSIGFLLVLVGQTLVFRSQSSIALTTIFEAVLFYFTAAVSEETFFRYYIQTKAEQSLPVTILGPLLAVVVTSLLFVTYHFGVYKTVLFALYAVFLSSLVMGTIYHFTKRLSVAQIIHASVNMAATFMAASFVAGSM